MSVIFEAENYRGLKKVRWAPSGVCALVGPNGSGKTTLLRLPELFRYALQRGLNEAVGIVGGYWGLQHLDSLGELVTLRASVRDCVYQLRVRTVLDRGIDGVQETVQKESKTILRRDFEATEYTFRDSAYKVDAGRLCLRQAVDRTMDPTLISITSGLSDHWVHSRYDLVALRERGSRTSSDMALDPTGLNAFTVLRNWFGKLEHRARYNFVVNGLRNAFPGTFNDLEFEPISLSVSANFQDKPTRFGTIPFAVAPDGLLVGLLHLTAVASADWGSTVGLDEFENSLHPHAIRSIIGSIREWCEDKDITIVLATHSPVVLDCFRDEKENVFVMEPGQEVQPCRITDLADPNWLAQFSLGQVYMDGEIGGPILNTPAPEAA